MKRIIYRWMIFGIMIITFLSGCGGKSTSNTPQSPQVYTGGFVTTDGNNYTPCYWVGTSRHDLPGVSPDTGVNSIYVGDKVYTAGYYYKSGHCVPCYWIADTQHDLDIPANNSGYANSIFISGNTIYIAGYYSNNSNNTPCYWINGTRQDLTIPDIPGVTDAWAKGIYVYGNTIYIAGTATSGANDYPTVWSGTHPLTTAGTMLLNTNGGGAENVFVNTAGTVYIAGCNRTPGNTPCYWQGNTRYDLTIPGGNTNMIASDIHVTDNGTVFTSGYGTFPYYWTGVNNSAKLSQPANTSDIYAESIFIANNIVYTAGSYYNTAQAKFIACYWQGTTMFPLSSDMSSGYARSIFVK